MKTLFKTIGAVLGASTLAMQDVGNLPDASGPPPDDGRAEISVTFIVPRGRKRIVRHKSGHIEGNYSVDRKDGEFIITPSRGCIFPEQPVQIGQQLHTPSTHGSKVVSPPVRSDSEIRLRYFSEGCHGFLGISCGWGYMNLDYDVIEECPVDLATATARATATNEELTRGVELVHPECVDNPCQVDEVFWKLTVTQGGRRACFEIAGEPQSGPCRVVVHQQQRDRLTVKRPAP